MNGVFNTIWHSYVFYKPHRLLEQGPTRNRLFARLRAVLFSKQTTVCQEINTIPNIHHSNIDKNNINSNKKRKT